MYQGIMTTNHGPHSYEAGFLHNASAGTSPVYVPTTRVVTPMMPSLPYLQTPGAPQQSSPASSHSAWAQPCSDAVPSYNHSSVSPRFAFSTSPPLSSTARDTAASYSGPLNISGNGREHYSARSLSGSYHSPYPAYMSPNVITCFGLSVLSCRYVGFAVVALLVEINSVFLHLRQMLRLAGDAAGTPYRVNSIVNLGTYVVFRINTLAWMTRWLVLNRDNVPLLAYTLGSLGMAIMTAMNIVLFCRLLRSDFLKGSGREAKKEKEKEK
ncbi:TLC domain-containing protein 2 [Liparis tanakae]|uniref:TLC domain-containing protein 2 n=1 Tax=Liparis tanakae TaxID=230148 RepID=A0A4Z2FTL9_9TELE|nr:TLC domain-containing protein 2 [Liparis tanakae]